MRQLILAGSFLVAFATTAFAGEYDNLCAMSLALGQKYPTDCSINETIDGKTYCFGHEKTKAMFMKDPKKYIPRADSAYAGK